MIDWEWLIENIEVWAIKRDLQKQSPLMQSNKTLEEVLELQQALFKDVRFDGNFYDLKEREDTMDAIGDIFVTLVVLCLQLDLDLMQCVNHAYQEIKDRKGKIVNGTFVKEKEQ